MEAGGAGGGRGRTYAVSSKGKKKVRKEGSVPSEVVRQSFWRLGTLELHFEELEHRPRCESHLQVEGMV